MGKKPNIILISSGQQRGDCPGPEQGGVRTPDLDRMGRSGARFSTFITPGADDYGQIGKLTMQALHDITSIYFGMMISSVDHQVGRILDALVVRGVLDNTYFLLISDHGE